MRERASRLRLAVWLLTVAAAGVGVSWADARGWCLLVVAVTTFGLMVTEAPPSGARSER